MFESAELGHRISKARYKRELPALRTALLDTQYRVVKAARFPVIIVVGGVDGAGKGETVNLLHEWMDPRHLRTHAFGQPQDEELGRPPLWRFWRRLPPKGELGIFFGSWYTGPIVARAMGETKHGQLEESIMRIQRFERILVDEGALILKVWFHLSHAAQRARLEELEAHKRTAWRVTKNDWENHRAYDAYREASAEVIRETSTADAPWLVVEGTDARYRNLTVGNALLKAMERQLEETEAAAREKASEKASKEAGKKGSAKGRKSAAKKAVSPPRTRSSTAPPIVRALDGRDVIDELDLTRKLEDAEYEEQLEKWQGRLNKLVRGKAFEKQSLVAVFEGSDAAGKGGTIRRVTAAIDARSYEVVPIAAPSEEERAHPYLWRFWRALPRLGRIALFDRSWYGRVLVERVEGLAPETDWMRAYEEIVDFEDQMTRNGAVVVKLWLQVSKDEQLRRFREREKVQFKRYKITDEDWRNRAKWDEYRWAACDMIDRTSTDTAPWTLVESEDKKWARVKVLRTICERLEAAR